MIETGLVIAIIVLLFGLCLILIHGANTLKRVRKEMAAVNTRLDSVNRQLQEKEEELERLRLVTEGRGKIDLILMAFDGLSEYPKKGWLRAVLTVATNLLRHYRASTPRKALPAPKQKELKK